MDDALGATAPSNDRARTSPTAFASGWWAAASKAKPDRVPAFSTTKARGAAATAADGDPPIDWRANLARYLESLPDDDDDDDDRGGARAAPAVDTK